MTDAQWHQLELEERRKHEEELLGDWDTWIAQERPWYMYWEEYFQMRKQDGYEQI
jgi:hypothetical protein